MQFASVPLNLAGITPSRKVLYALSGHFSAKAYKEAQKLGFYSKCIATTQDDGYDHVPEITPDMVDVRIDAKEGFAVAMENNVFAILDTTLNEDLVDEGLAREIISKIQQMRKQMQLEMMDNITISLGADEDVQKAVEKHADYIKSETLALSIEKAEDLKTVNINGHKTGLGIKKMC